MKQDSVEILVTDDVVLVQVSGIPITAAITAELFSAFANAGINIDLISHTPVGRCSGLSFTVMSSDFSKVLKSIAQLKGKMATMRTSVQGGYSKVTLRGPHFPDECGIASACFCALAQAEAECALISASDTSLSVLVQTNALDRTLSRLENTFPQAYSL